MSGEHGAHDRKFTDEEAAKAVADTIAFAATYPVGAPQPIAVILSDEQWVAVKAALQVALIIQSTDQMEYMPPGMADRAHQAWHEMHDQIKDVLRTLAENERKGGPLDEG